MFLSNVFSNLIGYDGLIFIVAIINLSIVFPKLRRISRRLNHTLNPVISRPIEELVKVFKLSGKNNLDLHVVKQQKEKENLYFQVYIAITSIFPLLGILGTIIAMLMLGDFSSELVVVNFTKALTSTFWGLVWAIFFKFLEGFIVPTVQQNEENLKLLLTQIGQYSQNSVGESDE